MWPQIKSVLVILLTVLCLLNGQAASSNEISLDMTVTSVETRVIVKLTNHSPEAVSFDALEVELEGRRQIQGNTFTLAAGHTGEIQFHVAAPALPGSYPLWVRTHYVNERQNLTLQLLGVFHWGQRAVVPISCLLDDATIRRQGRLELHAAKSPAPWRLLLPEEIAIIREMTHSDGVSFSLASDVTGILNHYPVYAVSTWESNGIHHIAMCQARLTLDARGEYSRGRLPDFGLLFLFGVAVALVWTGERFSFHCAWLRIAAARAIFLSLTYLLLRHAPEILTHLSTRFDPRGATTFLAEHFSGESYRLFFLYFADTYLIAGVVISGGYFFLRRRDRRVEEDKYLACLRTLVSLPALLAGKKPFWNETARRGTLTVTLKLFFVPYLTGWTIQNVLHFAAFFEPRYWDFYAINQALVDCCILVDTLVFTWGYLVESRRLKSEIRSVDPTLLGWAVCLWCYPPFNQFAFAPFDRAWFDIAIAADEMTRQMFTIAVTLLWAVFAWATLSLGLKASNLTSRGVVALGPYRFVRHPAYAAKLMVWYIQGIVFGEFTIGILLAFTVIYVLRALTEEWHLVTTDPAYEEYRRRVRWRFVPFVV